MIRRVLTISTHYMALQKIDVPNGKSLPFVAKVIAITSILLWAGIVPAGRFIGFV